MPHHISAVTEVGRPDGTLGVDLIQLLPGLDVPQPDGVVRGASDEVGGVPLWVQAPHGSTVTIIGPQSLTVDGVPHIGVVVLIYHRVSYYYIQLTTGLVTLAELKSRSPSLLYLICVMDRS